MRGDAGLLGFGYLIENQPSTTGFCWFALRALVLFVFSKMLSRLMERLRKSWDRLSELAEQYYTRRQLRALILFVLAGTVLAVYRGGRALYLDYFPEARSATELGSLRAQDSLFKELSAEAERKDSLFFSIPEDSLLPTSVLKKLEHPKKGADLAPHSIALNSASRDELMRLPGVGPATADRILAYRTERGRFRSIDELSEIQGFGAKHVARVREYLRLE